MKILKKIKHLIILLVLVNNMALSQAPSFATDFTYQDINGVSHHLFDYLNAGKTVIIDFSTTTCGPCWGFHNSHLLKDIYNDFGPDGTDELMVFLIEIDTSSTIADLYGTGPNTWGDWVTGTPYPIIDLLTFADVISIFTNYNISYVPTLYVICPDTSLTEILYNDMFSYYNIIHQAAECNNEIGSDAKLLMYSGDEGVCNDPEIKATVYNNGTDTITNLTAEAYNENTLISTQNWQGSLFPDDTINVNFGSITLNKDSANLNFEITTSDNNINNNFFSKTVFFAPYVNNQIRVKIIASFVTPMDVSWRIEDENSNIIIQSDYLDINMTYDSVYTIPQGCHYFIMSSDTGYALYGNSVLVSDNTGKIIQGNPGYGSEVFKAFYVNSTVKIDETFSEYFFFSFSPNPVNDNLLLETSQSFSENITIQITTLLEQMVYNDNIRLAGNQEVTIDLSGLKKGVYIINARTGNHNISEKIIKQ